MDNLFMHDTCRVIIVDDNTGNKYFYGTVETANLVKTVDSEVLTADIGNVSQVTLYSGQSMELTVNNLFNNPTLIAMQTSGIDDWTTSTVVLTDTETSKAEDDGAGGAQIVLSADATPVDDVVQVVDDNNKQYTATYTNVDQTVAITDGVVGEVYTVIYDESKADAEVLVFDVEKFPSDVHVQIRTIAYDANSDTSGIVKADVYWDFPKASPDGGFEQALNKGENNGTSTTFMMLRKRGETSLGKQVIVPRV